MTKDYFAGVVRVEQASQRRAAAHEAEKVAIDKGVFDPIRLTIHKEGSVRFSVGRQVAE
jgi:hypothetical protein